MDERESGNKDDQARDQDTAKKPRPTPGPRKIAEPPGNLQKREDWFRKRSG
jgi:hypothetical protein